MTAVRLYKTGMQPQSDLISAAESDLSVTDNVVLALSGLTSPSPPSVALPTVYAAPSLLDPATWAASGNYTPLGASGVLWERRSGWPCATVLLDTTPPDGDALLAEGTDPLQVHQFSAFAPTTSTTASLAQSDTVIASDFTAISVVSPASMYLASVTLYLKASAAPLGPSGGVFTVHLYGDGGVVPNLRLATSSTTLAYSTLTTAYVAYTFALPAQIVRNGAYWIVVEETGDLVPTGGTVSIKGVTSTSGVCATSADGATWNVLTGTALAYGLVGADNALTPLACIDELVSPDDIVTSVATSFGGSADPSTYVLLGGGTGSRTLVKRMTANPDGTLPIVASIQVGLTANKTHAYSVEARASESNPWTTLFTWKADLTENPFYSFVFTTPVSLSSIRIRDRGEVYVSTDGSTVSLSGYDALTGVTSAQVSRYSDFRDAGDMAGTDASGWFAFPDGTLVIDPWQLSNPDRQWSAVPGVSGASNVALMPTPAGVALITSGNGYTVAASVGNLQATTTVPAGEQYTAVCAQGDGIYYGTNHGTLVGGPASGGAPASLTVLVTGSAIAAMASFGGRLWIGSALGSDGNSYIYTWDGQALSQRRFFKGQGITSLAVFQGLLFVGLSDGTNGYVQFTDGASWTPSLTVLGKPVTCLGGWPAGNVLLSGHSGGHVSQLSFTSQNLPQTWSTFYDGPYGDYLAITPSSTGAYLYLLTTTEILACSLATGSFTVISPPLGRTQGLKALWQNSDSSHVATYRTEATQVIVANGGVPSQMSNLVTSRPGGINTTYFNVQYTGFIRADRSELYTFYLIADDGAQIMIGGNTVVSTSQVGVETRGTIALVAGQWTPITIEAYNATGGSYMSVSWASASVPKQPLPLYSVALPSSVPTALTLTAGTLSSADSKLTVAASDDRVYRFDESLLTTTTRSVYARFRDAAGNATTGVGFTDSVIEDAGTATSGSDSGTTRISDGHLYQVLEGSGLVAAFLSPVQGALAAPDRSLRVSGYMDSDPFYAPTLTRWDTISFIATLPSTSADPNSVGLDYGVEVDLYVRSGDTQAECLAADWGSPFTRSTILPSSSANGIATSTFSIATVPGKWLQWRLELVTASRLVTPVVQAVTLTFLAAEASYFFSAMFDTSTLSTSVPAPYITRLLLTAPEDEAGGLIQWGYTIDDSPNNTFDFSLFTPIETDTVVELPVGVQTSIIRLGALLISQSSTPAVIQDWAVLLDVGAANLQWMA